MVLQNGFGMIPPSPKVSPTLQPTSKKCFVPQHKTFHQRYSLRFFFLFLLKTMIILRTNGSIDKDRQNGRRIID